MKNNLTVLVLAVGIGLGGYAFAEHHEHSDHPGHADHEAAAPQDTSMATEVANKVCPVDGEKIGSMGEAVKVEHERKVYNLCCAACVLKFKEDPEKYAGIVKKELEAEASEKEESVQLDGHDHEKHEGHNHVEHDGHDHK